MPMLAGLSWPRLALVSVLASGLLLAACQNEASAPGSGSERFVGQATAAEILDAGRDAMERPSSMRLTAQGADLVMEQGPFDLRVDRDGNCSGWFGRGAFGRGDLVGAGGRYYVRAGAAYWVAIVQLSLRQVRDRLADRWVLLPEEEDEDFARLCDLDRLLTVLTTHEGANLEKGEVIDYQGIAAVELRSATVGAHTTFVAVDTPHYIVRVDRASESGGVQKFTASEFDKSLRVGPPPEGDVVDLVDVVEATLPKPSASVLTAQQRYVTQVKQAAGSDGELGRMDDGIVVAIGQDYCRWRGSPTVSEGQFFEEILLSPDDGMTISEAADGHLCPP